MDALKRIWFHLEHNLFHPTMVERICLSPGPVLAKFCKKKQTKLQGRDSNWRTSKEDRDHGLWEIYQSLATSYRADFETFLSAAKKQAGTVRKLAIKDARRFVVEGMSVTQDDFIVKVDLTLAPTFLLFHEAPAYIVDKLAQLYDAKREQLRLLDPNYDILLLRRVDALLSTSVSTSPPTSPHQHSSSENKRSFNNIEE